MGLKSTKASRILAFPSRKRFHFGAVKDDPGLHTLQKVVVIAGGAILRDDEFARLVGGLRRCFWPAWPQLSTITLDEKGVTECRTANPRLLVRPLSQC